MSKAWSELTKKRGASAKSNPEIRPLFKVLGFLIFVAVCYIVVAPLFQSSKAPTPEAKPIPRLTPKDVQFAERLIETHVVVRIEPNLRRVFVNPLAWARANYDEKIGLLRWSSVYVAKANGDDSSIVELINYSSGKKLAQVGVFGEKIY